MPPPPSDAGSCFEDAPGGRELLAWFGEVPSFHDGEILSLHLNREGPSFLRIRTRHGLDDHRRHAIVTFTLEGISHLKLDDFSHQNVIGSLTLRRGSRQPDLRPQFWHAPPEPDYEIELEPCFGLAGIIRARHVRVDFILDEDVPNRG